MSSHLYTILFTDIEGSTRLWEQQAERMAEALAGHDALARAAVTGNRGIIVKTTGDGLYAAFEDSLDALNATVTLQQSIADPAATNGIPLRVRCGLHSGQVERRDNDYFGSPVNRTARVMSVAHGGQILLSQAVVDDVAERLPADVTLKDLGSVRLKDLSQPEHVYQVLHPSLRQDFPALRSLEATPNNLPQQLTSFIGREREVDEAKELLKSSRLVTLLGMGGLGKTRLSLQIAADMMDAFPDGVWFVDLAPIRDDSLVPSVTAQVLGVQEEPGRALTQTLCAHLKSRKLVLIFDNCEHVVGASAALANALLRAAPDVRMIATTREALRVPGEQTYPVYPLAVPDRAASVETLSRSAAVQLFMDRAQLQKPGFMLTEKEAPAVAELVARLEGIPLALELAAARMRALSIQDINKRLQDRFKLLTGGGRVLLERQQTLRALVAWSYDMLHDPEQRLLERLSVFAGGFDLEAAEAICGAEPLSSDDVLDLLTSLVEKSLVMADESDNGSRYRQLETIREFAREYLAKRDDAAEHAVRHCDFFLVLAKASNKALQGAEQAEFTRRLEVELDNLRAAIALALNGGADPVLAVKFEVALMWFRLLRGYSTEGRKIVRATLALPGVQASDVAHAHALYVGAALADNQADYAEAGRMLEACLALRRGLDQPFDIAATLSTLSQVRLHEGDAERARESEEEALGIFRKIGDRVGEAIGLFHLGEICRRVADDVKARDYFEQCLAIARAIDSAEIEGESELVLGALSLAANDLPAARARFARSLEVCRSAENKRGEAMALWWTGKADAAGGDTEAARQKLAEALRALQMFEMNSEVLSCLEDHAELLQSIGSPDDGVSLFAAVEMLRDRLALSRSPRDESHVKRVVAGARATLGDALFDAAWAEGRTWELEQATRRALIALATVAA
ncbi:MAG: tetratricopeptide repeat protein [Betaproteobacteria bacterium]